MEVKFDWTLSVQQSVIFSTGHFFGGKNLKKKKRERERQRRREGYGTLSTVGVDFFLTVNLKTTVLAAFL